MAQKKALLVTEYVDEEFFTLASSLNYKILDVLYFKNHSSRYYISVGKMLELKTLVHKYHAEIVIFNSTLKSSHWYNLEKELHVEVADRIRLIINIFRDRAHSKEARLETELAELIFEVPLLKEWVHWAKKGEHPGFMAAGEYDIVQYLNRIKKKIKKIKQQLEKIKKQRAIQRKNRSQKGYFLVSLAGYTNSGKSTLMHALSNENVKADKRMFSTLVPKTAKLIIKQRILITDTVGFIRNVPPWLIDSFQATLEEIFSSDIVLLVVDSTESLETFKDHFNVSYRILKEHTLSKTIVVVNKIDLAPSQLSEKLAYIKEHGLEPVCVSAKKKLNIDVLLEQIEKNIDYDREYEYIGDLKTDYKSLLSFILLHGKLLKLEEGEKIYIRFKINNKSAKYLKKYNI